MVQVILGIGLLGWWAHRRDRRTARRDEALKFIEQTASRLNVVFSAAFGLIQRGDLSEAGKFYAGVGRLFDRRLAIRVKSEALFGCRDFAKAYERIMFQLKECRQALQGYEDRHDDSQLLSAVKSAVPPEDHDDLELWGSATGPGALPKPWGYLETWLEWLWSMSDELLSEALKAALKGQRRFQFTPGLSLRRQPEGIARRHRIRKLLMVSRDRS